MVSKVDNKNKNNNDYKDFSDESDDEVDNGYSGFNLIPDKYDSDDESVYSENNNVGYEITPDGDTYEEYIKNNKEDNQNENDNIGGSGSNNGGDNIEEGGDENGFGDFVDFKNHSEQFHNLDSFNNNNNNNDNDNDNDIEAKLKSNPMLRGIDLSDYFPKVDNDPFTNSDDLTTDNSSSSNNNNNNNNNQIYSERNEKGHMVLERNKLFPPDHVAVIQECMKNIKLDYKPMWTNFITEDKWLGALKNKISPATPVSTTNTSLQQQQQQQSSLNNNNNNNNNSTTSTNNIDNSTTSTNTIDNNK